MNDLPEQLHPHWEEQINALLDDELDPSGVAALEIAAADNPLLSRAIAESLQLKQLLVATPAVPAPRSLRRKLRGIPAAQETGGRWSWWHRGAVVGALALALVVANPGGPQQPDELEIAQGRRDLALALSYLGRATRTTNTQINRRINGAVINPLTRSTLDTLRHQFFIEQEYYL